MKSLSFPILSISLLSVLGCTNYNSEYLSNTLSPEIEIQHQTAENPKYSEEIRAELSEDYYRLYQNVVAPLSKDEQDIIAVFLIFLAFTETASEIEEEFGKRYFSSTFLEAISDIESDEMSLYLNQILHINSFIYKIDESLSLDEIDELVETIFIKIHLLFSLLGVDD